MLRGTTGRRVANRSIVITISGETKSFVERITTSGTKIRANPDFYRPVHFILNNRRSLLKYQDHFIYHYLEALSRTSELPSSLLFARKLEVTLVIEDNEE